MSRLQSAGGPLGRVTPNDYPLDRETVPRFRAPLCRRAETGCRLCSTTVFGLDERFALAPKKRPCSGDCPVSVLPARGPEGRARAPHSTGGPGRFEKRCVDHRQRLFCSAWASVREDGWAAGRARQQLAETEMHMRSLRAAARAHTGLGQYCAWDGREKEDGWCSFSSLLAETK